jgi:hypothetical protein
MKTKISISFRADTIPGEAAAILTPTACGADVAEVNDYSMFGVRNITVYITLDETDERGPKVLALLQQYNVEVDHFCYTEYSEEDRQNARLLRVGPSEYLEKITILRWNGTKFDITNACPNCEAGEEQMSPVYIDRDDMKLLRKHRAVLVSFHALIVDGGIRKRLVDACVTGISFGDVRMRLENGKWSEVARDQVFATHTLPPMRVDLTPEIEKPICKVCQRSGWRYVPDVPYREEDLIGMQDFNLSWEWFGEFWPENREKKRPVNGSYPHLYVTPKVMNIFREAGVKSFDWRPVNVAP